MKDNSKRFASKLLLALLACVVLSLSACNGAVDDSGLLPLLSGDSGGSALSVNGENAGIWNPYVGNCVF